MDEEIVRADVVAFLARRTGEGMEPDDLLCSRIARPEKALVGRAQSKANHVRPDRGEEKWSIILVLAHVKMAYLTRNRSGWVK